MLELLILLKLLTEEMLETLDRLLWLLEDKLLMLLTEEMLEMLDKLL